MTTPMKFVCSRHVRLHAKRYSSWVTCFLRRVHSDRDATFKTRLDHSSYLKRTHTCGELRLANVGSDVTLCGWLQYQRMDSFLVLRDWKGLIQIIVPEHEKTIKDLLSKLNYETILEVKGQVIARPAGQENKAMVTGDVEVVATDITVLNECKPTVLPFEMKSFHKVKESLRLEYRYLDLRQPNMQHNLRLRSQMVMKIRDFLCNMHGFVDVETPTLFRRTPGGAKEFIVPTRFPGKFYSLPQSPQQFKQLLMAGGIDRYFQIARCYRDEQSKPDRQPEFTQVDLEMSFVDQESILDLVEHLLLSAWPDDKESITVPFPRMLYKDAMEQYGTDKPDIRFDMKLEDVTSILYSSGVPLFQQWQKDDLVTIQALRIPDGQKYISNKKIQEIKEKYNEKSNIAVIRVQNDGSWRSPITKHIQADTRQRVTTRLHLQPGDLVLLTGGHHYAPHTALGKYRLECANILESQGVSLRERGTFSFLWIQDFPLFLHMDDGACLESAHHPFTAPHPEDMHLLTTRPEQVRSQHYDLVLNGQEIGGGSIRIHDSEQQKFVLENILKEDSSELHHLLEALDSGCPPHGGIALGLDRLLAIICGADSIRDVIAFPKSLDGKDLLSKAPSAVSEKDLNDYHIKVTS